MPESVKEGVTVIVEVTDALPELIALKEPMLPVPLAPRPIEALELVQAIFYPSKTTGKIDGGRTGPIAYILIANGIHFWRWNDAQRACYGCHPALVSIGKRNGIISRICILNTPRTQNRGSRGAPTRK
jgi:hypothetical protein